MTLRSLIALAYTVLLFVAALQPSARDAALDEELKRRNELLLELGEKNDSAGAAALHTENAILLPPGGRIVEGREAIERFLTTPASVTVRDSTIDVLQTGGSADVAWLVGDYDYTVAREGTESEVSGRYVIVWTRNDAGDWQVQVDMWNASRR